jgi:hypothetical protein
MGHDFEKTDAPFASNNQSNYFQHYFADNGSSEPVLSIEYTEGGGGGSVPSLTLLGVGS